jgi:photosynthetic reaction center H subunit
MPGAITQQIDVAQLMVAAFFVFFAGLVFYLRREDKREGYPLVDDERRGLPPENFEPPAKVYQLLTGGTAQMPHREAPSRAAGRTLMRFPGAPLVPVGDAMRAEIGPGAFPLRLDEPFMALGFPQVRPLRVATDWAVMKGDTDPRGATVYDGRRDPVGTVRDLWVDRAVKILRYLEVELDPRLASAATGPVLVPIYYAVISERRRAVRVPVMFAANFARIPRPAHPDQISAREEDRLTAYFAGAQFYGRGHEGGVVEFEPAAGGVR